MHAFSLSWRRLPKAQGSGLRFPNELAQLWGRLVVEDLPELDRDPTRAVVKARGYFELVGSHLLGLPNSPRSDRGSALRCAALALELSARTWQAFGPAAGRRHAHLWRRLEAKLAATDREIRAAELPLRVNRASASLAVRGACTAIDHLLAGEADVAEALAALEDASVDVAALSVRIAEDSTDPPGARRGSSVRRAGLEHDFRALASEVSAAARTRLAAGERGGADDRVGGWLRAALAIAPPREVVELSGCPSAEPYLRGDALCSLRARWLELAGVLWGVVHRLDELLAIPTFADDARLQRIVSARAERLVLACDLCRRPSAFDHEEAWRRLRNALGELVNDVCAALESRDTDDVLRSQQLAVRRLIRIVAAIWAIDESVRFPPRDADGGRR